MNKKLLAVILGILVGTLITTPTFSFAQKETDSDKPEAHCDAYENDENKLSEENKKQVIVIGAGISGLSAAHHLKCKGYDVTVLEALNRTGGRINTDISTGIPLDLGASWIHGIEGSPIFKIVTKMDKRSDIIITNQESSVAYDVNGNNADTRVEEFWEKMDTNFKEIYDEKKSEAGNDDSFDSAIKEYTDKYVKTDEDRENFYYYAYWQYVLDDAADAKYVSLKFRDQFAEYPSIEVAFRNGYHQVIDYLADGIDIQKEHVVTKIDYNKPEVLVNFQDITGNHTSSADYVVSTLPLGILKNKGVKVVFSPSINESSPEKQNAIDHLDIGVYNKAYYIFDEKDFFWKVDKDKDWISRIPGKDEKMGQWGVFFNFYKYTGKPILLAFNSGNYSRQLNDEAFTKYPQDTKKQDEYIASKGLEVLQKMYPNETVPPISNVKTLVTTWEREPYFGGSFTYFTKGATPSDFDEISRPLSNPDGENKIFFAGEATIPRLFSTVNGAYVSGIREAEKIQREDGILDSISQQLEYGIHPTSVVCHDTEHLLILKTGNYSPICVTEKAKQELTNRMVLNNTYWAINPENYPFSYLEENSNHK